MGLCCFLKEIKEGVCNSTQFKENLTQLFIPGEFIFEILNSNRYKDLCFSFIDCSSWSRRRIKNDLNLSQNRTFEKEMCNR